MIPKNRDRVLSREVTVTQIPSGDKQVLPVGSRIQIHQTLGGSYTVQTDHGLFRIDGKDGDALGEEASDHTIQAETLADGAPSPDALWDQLRKVYDPEIPVNIVDLGLIYDCHLSPLGDNSYKADVKMTLTAPGCGMGPVLAQDVQNKLISLEGIEDVNVELVWEPQWNQNMMTEAAKLQLGLL